MYGRIPYLNIDWNSWTIHHSFLSPPSSLTSGVVRVTIEWSPYNSIVKQFWVYSINVISIEAELMAICTSLIPTMEMDNIHDIIVITDSLTAARQILESKVNSL